MEEPSPRIHSILALPFSRCVASLLDLVLLSYLALPFSIMPILEPCPASSSRQSGGRTTKERKERIPHLQGSLEKACMCNRRTRSAEVRGQATSELTPHRLPDRNRSGNELRLRRALNVHSCKAVNQCDALPVVQFSPKISNLPAVKRSTQSYVLRKILR